MRTAERWYQIENLYRSRFRFVWFFILCFFFSFINFYAVPIDQKQSVTTLNTRDSRSDYLWTNDRKKGPCMCMEVQ